MNCEHVEQDLTLFLEGELPQARRRYIEAHLESCERCAETLQELEKLPQVLQRFREIEPPETLFETIRTRAESMDRRRHLTAFAGKTSMYLAGAILIICLALFIKHRWVNPEGDSLPVRSADVLYSGFYKLFPDLAHIQRQIELVRHAAQQGMQSSTISGLTLTQLRVPEDIYMAWDTPGISPDGRKLAYVARGDGWPLRISVIPVAPVDSDVLAEPEVLLKETKGLMAIYTCPTWSPDGEWIAFYRLLLPDKALGVYAIPAEGGEMCLLASIDNETSTMPGSARLSWSPDSRELAFVLWKGEDARDMDIHIVSMQANQMRPFTADHNDNSFPSWSSDGKKIAYNSRKGIWLGDSSRTWVKPVNGGEAFTMGEYINAPVVWSPDGKMIASTGFAPDSRKMGFVAAPVDSQGRISGAPILLKEEELNVMKRILHWTSDGKLLLLREDYQESLSVVDLTNGGITLLDDTQLIFEGIQWSPDGRRIFLPYGKDRRFGFLNIDSNEFNELHLENLDAITGGAVLSPDGEMIAFSAIERESLTELAEAIVPKGGVQIYIVPASGGKPRQLTGGDFFTGDIHWSPDSRSIAFVRAEIGPGEKEFRSRICVTAVDDGEMRSLTEAAFNMEPTWSLDGTMIAYIHLRPHKEGIINPEEMEGDIYVISATGGQPRQLTDSPEREECISWSPDGSMIAFKTGGRTWIVPVAGGRPEQVCELGGKHISAVVPSGWLSNGKYLLALGRSSDPRDASLHKFWKIPVDGGEPVELHPARVSPRASPISMSPDGTRVILRENRSKMQYWMMEGVESLISGKAH